MDWSSVGKQLANIGLPLLGGAVGGPGGALAAKGLLAALGLSAASTPEQAATALGNMTGEQLVSLRQIEAEVAKAQIKAGSDQIEAVNKTLQTEAMGGSWLQRNHHALESMAVVSMMIGVYFVLPLLQVKVPDIPEFAFMMLGAILGVTAWQRGQANVQVAKQP